MTRIQCPHCEYEFTDDDMHDGGEDLWAIWPNEGNTKACPNCGELFWIKDGYSPDYEIYRTEKE